VDSLIPKRSASSPTLRPSTNELIRRIAWLERLELLTALRLVDAVQADQDTDHPDHVATLVEERRVHDADQEFRAVLAPGRELALRPAP
jgi:hypothetical protein